MKRKKNILVELTPLLDVILLILFLVLLQSQGLMETLYADTQEALEAQLAYYSAAFAAEVEEMRRELGEDFVEFEQRANELNALLSGLTDDTTTVVISIIASPTDSYVRHILVESGAGITYIPLSSDSLVRNAATLALSTALVESNTGGAVTFIVFKLDRGRTFTTDYALVRNAIINHQLHVSQVFSAVLDIRA